MKLIDKGTRVQIELTYLEAEKLYLALGYQELFLEGEQREAPKSVIQLRDKIDEYLNT